ncbi:MAG: MazG nucleotide pyrophosphohydrolase domain-containing protein [Desulfocapsaceae bacterium]|nr:MazG nucleotide pyrophosphohydrolase domain-containing protein [Desulfocapsaceae bacterium]
MPTDAHHFSLLLHTVRSLLGPDGCPWDQKQSTLSLKKYFREEFAEIITAIDNNDPENLCEELGDMLFLVILMAEINKKNGTFTLQDILRNINEKMIRRHPHVFADGEKGTEEELEKQWRAIKSQEKEKKIN